MLKKHGVDLTAIGIVTKKKDIVLVDNGNKRILENKGYEHFRKHHF
jgi:thiamine monophosphate kinase